MTPAKKLLGIAALGYMVYLYLNKSEQGAGISDGGEEPGPVDGFVDELFDFGYRAAGVFSGGVGDMEISMAGIAMIKQFEGFRNTVYFDVAGNETIGYGHKLTSADKAAGLNFVTEAEASNLLAKDLTDAERAVNRYVKVPLSPNQYDALVSLVYNWGSGHFWKSRNGGMLAYLRAQNYTAAANEFGAIVFAGPAGKKVISKGLVNRRQAEYNMFIGKNVVST